MNKLPVVWNKKVNPVDYPGFTKRKVKPITWEDLENQFHTIALRHLKIKKIDSSSTQSFPKCRVVNIKETLDLYTKIYDFGRVIAPMWSFIVAENFREVVDEIARRKLYISNIVGYVPTCIPGSLYWAEYKPPLEVHEYLLEKLGHRFIGWENGEQDGRYVAGYAKMFCPAPLTRRQAYKYFMEYFHRLCNDLQNYLVSQSTLTFPHYFAHMGNHRLLGAEIGARLCVPLLFAFLRGAGKQYGILWFCDISLWNHWGYFDPDREENVEFKEKDHRYTAGPTAGLSLSLLRRLWYLGVMYDCVMIGLGEKGHLSRKKTTIRMIEGKPRKVPALTAIGKLQLEGMNWVRRHPNRGTMYTPIALILDFYTGWTPPRHYYPWGGEPYMVWGNMPYQKGDHQIDLFFREIFPGYENCSYYRDERGILTPTPYGDIFDVLLSNVPDFVLNRYNAVIMLGEIHLKGDVLEKIRKFVEAGGSLVVFANQLQEDADDLLGIQLLKSTRECDHAILTSENLVLREPTYTMHKMKIIDANINVLAITRHREPLVTCKKHTSDGEVLVFAADYGLSDRLAFKKPIFNECERPLPSPYQILEHVRALLLPWLRNFNLIKIIGPPIQFLTSVTEDPTRLLVTLCNNDVLPWFGYIRIKRAKIARAVNWMTDKSLQGGSYISIKVPPHDIVILELHADRPIVRFKEG